MSNVTVKKTGTPTISVIEDEQGVCYEISEEISGGVIITRMSTDFLDTLVEHPTLNEFKVNG